jgi:hypothetical protein
MRRWAPEDPRSTRRSHLVVLGLISRNSVPRARNPDRVFRYLSRVASGSKTQLSEVAAHFVEEATRRSDSERRFDE